MSIDASNGQTTPLHEVLKATALEAYGSLLSPDLAEKAALSFADEANTMLETMIAEHSQALRERIEAQLAGMTLGKGAKRKAPKPPAITNGANGTANGHAESTAKFAPEADVPVEPKPAKAAEEKATKAAEAKNGRVRKRTGGRTARA